MELAGRDVKTPMINMLRDVQEKGMENGKREGIKIIKDI